MKISDTATMHASAGQVWAALTDPVVLAAAIPGCERLEHTSPDHWHFALTTHVASIHGTITGDAKVLDRQQQASLTISARGAGGAGTVTATIRIALTPGAADTTELRCDADAEVGGQLASVGQKMLASAATRLTAQFLTAMDQHLTGNEVVFPGPAQAARVSAQQPAADSSAASFLPGVLAGGAAGAVAGFVAARLIARRGR